MRVAVVSNTAWYLFNFRLNLMLALQAEGYVVVAVAPRDIYADRILAVGIPFEAVAISGGGTNPVKELRSVFNLHALSKRKRFEVVLSYTPKGNLYSALACIALNTPFIPNVSGLGRVFIRRSPITWVVKTLYRLTFRRAQHVFFQNPEDMSVFVHAGLVRRDQAERLPGSGVDLARFSPAPQAGNPADGPVFLLVARLLWDKGVGEFIAAARQVREDFPRASFRLLGALGSNNPSAIPWPDVDGWVKEGLVTYLGPTDDVRPFLAAADCVVLPSYREGVPRVLLEAAAMARPVITTAAPGCRDAVVHGQTGFMCAARDADALAVMLRKFMALLPQERAEMGVRGRAFVERNFDEKAVLARYLSVVAGVAADLRRKDGQLAKNA